MKQLIVLALALAGCGPNYDRTDISDVITSTPKEEVSKVRIVVTKGTIVKAHIESFNSSSKNMSNDVASDDPNIVLVKPVVSDHDYGFLGITAGRTVVSIKADGELVLLVDALVVDQPLP